VTMPALAMSVNTTYTAAGCRHKSEKVIYHDTPYGKVLILVCTDPECNYSEMHCEHTQNSWNKAGTELTCDLCGEDGT
jgi:hypothetical protein